MLINMLYQNNSTDWRQKQDTVHLLMNHRSYLDKHFKEYPEFNESNIVNYPYTFGQMARDVWSPN